MIYEGANITVSQSVLLIQSFALRYALSQSAIGDLLQLINILLPDPSRLPQSYYTFSKCFPDPRTSVKTVMCCSNINCRCIMPLHNDNNNCPTCGSKYSEQQSLKDGSYFISISLADQLRHILESNSNELCRKSSQDNQLNDIQDSVLYKSCNFELTTDITLVWNCDGVPLFKSSPR